MRLLGFILFIGIFLHSCGVKAPPIAIKKNQDPELKLDCSPFDDPECDEQDPNFSKTQPTK